MNISATEAAVHLVCDKTDTEFTGTFKQDQLVVKSLNNLYEINFKVAACNIERKVLVDNYCNTEMFSLWAQQEKSIEQVLDGYDICILYLSSGTNRKAIHKNRLNNQELILRTLQSKIIDTKNKIKIDYAHIRLEDNNYFDMRKDISYTNESMLERGISQLMRRIEDFSSIWYRMKRTSAGTPFMLNIRVRDEKKKTEGNLLLVDLAHPVFTFNSLTINEAKEFRYSSVHLYNTVCKMNYSDDIEEVPYLTKEMLPYILGDKKLIVCGYFQDSIENRVYYDEIKLCLDFISNLRGTRTYMIRNLSKMNTDSRLVRDLQNENNDIRLAYKELEKQLNIEQSHSVGLTKQMQYNNGITKQMLTSLNELREKKEEQEELLEDLTIMKDKLNIALDKERHKIFHILRAVKEIIRFRRGYNV